jgi:PAS domain-containing protein
MPKQLRQQKRPPLVSIALLLLLGVAIVRGVDYTAQREAIISDLARRKDFDAELLRDHVSLSLRQNLNGGIHQQEKLASDAIAGRHRNTTVIVVYYDQEGNQIELANNRKDIRDDIITPEAEVRGLQLLAATRKQDKNIEYVEFTEGKWPARAEYHLEVRPLTVLKGSATVPAEIILITNLSSATQGAQNVALFWGAALILVVAAGVFLIIAVNLSPISRLTKDLAKGHPLTVSTYAPTEVVMLADAIDNFRAKTEMQLAMLEIAAVPVVHCRLEPDQKEALIVYANPAFLKTFGYNSPEGMPLNTIVPKGDHAYHCWGGVPGTPRAVGMGHCPHGPAQGSKVLSGSRIVEAIRSDGKTLSILLSVNRIADGIKGDRNFVGTLQDVTDLATARNKAEQYAKQIEDNQRIWRHDLLSSAKGTLDMLEVLEMLGFDPGDDFAESYELTKTAARACYTLIKETRDLTDSQVTLKLQEVTITSIWEALKPSFISYNVVFDTPPDGATITVDPQQFGGRALANLINNAVKYGGSGLVRVAYVKKGDRHLFVVRDSGPGLSQEQIEKITSGIGVGVRLNPEIPGSGLGLYSVRQIVEAHGGTLDVKSQLGRGSAFIISLVA